MSGSVLLDLDRYLLDRDLTVNSFITAGATPILRYNSSPFRPSSLGVGFGYIDECTTFTVNYTRSTSDNVGAVKATTARSCSGWSSRI